MERILRNKDLEVGKNYIVRSKTNGSNSNYKPVAEVTMVKELSGMKVIFDRIWATDDNNQALDRYEVYGPIDLDEMIIPIQMVDKDIFMEKLNVRPEQFEMTKRRMGATFDNFQEEFSEEGRDSGSYYDIMVLQVNGYWVLANVIGKSLSGYLLFSGWFIGGCLDVKDYMTIDEFNEIKPYNYGYGEIMFNVPVEHSNYSNIRA